MDDLVKNLVQIYLILNGQDDNELLSLERSIKKEKAFNYSIKREDWFDDFLKIFDDYFYSLFLSFIKIEKLRRNLK